MTIAEGDSPSREWVLYHDAGRVLASALARLINAYEMSPERAQHALSWEHLPGRVGSRYPISERDEASARKYSDSAKQVIETSMLHEGRDSLSEYSQLLDDWDLIHGKADEESFKLDEYLDQKDYDWHATGIGMTDAEKRQLQGWSTEDVERLRSRDPELLNEYRREIEQEAMKEAAKGRDYIESEENRRVWVEARLADLESAANAKMLGAYKNDLDVQQSRWERIERMRSVAENQGRNLLWRDIVESADSEGLTLPERPAKVEWDFPDCLTPEVRIIYDATEQTRSQLWTTSKSQDVVDEYEKLIGQLVALCKEIPTTPAIARYMEWNEGERTSIDRSIPRLPIPTDYGWPEYYGLVLDDEAYLDREINEDVRKSGNLWIHWAKELVGMLPAVTKRAVELGKHPISDIPKDRVPESLSVLFEQAHLCYLFNLEIPCVMTCGSLIEEAIEAKFPELKEEWRRRQWADKKSVPWRSKLEEVARAYLPFGRVWGLAWKVVQKRNEAVHDPTKYLKESKGQSERILRGSRDVLKALFETEQ
ncbi:MAG: hypothetical protein ABR987_12085 [Terracidiphilus sp.]